MARRQTEVRCPDGANYAEISFWDCGKITWAKIDVANVGRVATRTWATRGIRHPYPTTKLANGQRVTLHVFLFGNAPEGTVWDHINRDPADNRSHNLRVASISQNIVNAKKRRNTSSKYKGVFWCRRGQVWRAHIQKNYRQIRLGSFISEDDAARAYNKASLAIWGEFAKLNDVPEVNAGIVSELPPPQSAEPGRKIGPPDLQARSAIPLPPGTPEGPEAPPA